MFYPNKKEFIKLSRKGNLIPVYKEIVADMETPVSAYKKVAGQYSFLLESVEGGEKIARYSFIGTDPDLIHRGSFEGIKEILSQFKAVKIKGVPPFHGGLVGYISYDAVRRIENIPDKNPDELNLPESVFMLTDTILAFDHIRHKIVIISNAHVKGSPSSAYDLAVKKIKALEKKLAQSLQPDDFEIPHTAKNKLKVRSNMTQKQYEQSVKKAKEYIRAGDIIQVVLSQRLEADIKADPFNVYRVLRTINPSPYMYYLKFGDLKIIGSSPEVMVRLENGEVTIRPIAGTRRRGESEEEDKKLEKELLASVKERAEHVMLVDLARNDIGRVCNYGSVRPTSLMEVERYSHVMHIVSNVTGRIKKNKDAFDLLRATFPAGTVTGAPKVRAMEIIDELEKTRRGPYAGVVGYFSFSGDLDSCITIRTIVVKKKKAYVQAGAGIVADSNPTCEYHETLNKAKALLKAIELTQ